MESFSKEDWACEELNELKKKNFADKKSTVKTANFSGTLIIDHIDSMFIKQIEEYEVVINNPDKFNEAEITAIKNLHNGYVGRVKVGHLDMFRDYRSTVVRTAIETVEIKIKGKLYFTISREELNKAIK